ncbi:MAG: glycosyltransferase family protein [Spirochaetaceae bacterium]|jgi:hypothetical protein|nr:glycosyltransferase family protein [Spirochaetaceae bacterium]
MDKSVLEFSTAVKKGVSVITCSVDPELCNKMIESVKKTIGTDFETIVFDNREKNLGICQVYNYCAQKSKYSYLCFIHEDIIMPSKNWGKTMVEFADKTPDCGIIGFAGCTIASKNFISWWWEYGKGRCRFYDPKYSGKAYSLDDLSYKYDNPANEEFAKVVTLDGLFLFVAKDVWKEYPFDEERIKGFHFYDADFSFRIALNRQNYVCLTSDIYHFSRGNYEKIYYEYARIFQKKWKKTLPFSVEKQKIRIIAETNNGFNFLIQSIRLGFTIKDSVKHFLEINGLFSIFVLLTIKIGEIIKKGIKFLTPYGIVKLWQRMKK